jgi:hypothetical protein
VAERLYELLLKDRLGLDVISYSLVDAVQVLRRGAAQASRWTIFIHMGGQYDARMRKMRPGRPESSRHVTRNKK